MSGYTRQSTADIIPTAVVRAAPINAELNALRDAFDFDTTGVTGHRHDGSLDQGSYVPLIADIDGRNSVAVDTTNNRVGVFIEVASAPVEQVRFQDGVFFPVTNNDVDLGTSTLEFRNLFIDGTAKVDTLAVDENATIAGTLGVTGLSTLPTVNVDGGTIDGAVIGGSSPQAITGTNVTATTGFSGTLTGNVTGNLTGNSVGTHTGAVIGDVTGNVSAGSGSSSFNDVTINGSLNLNVSTSGTVTGLSAPVNGTDAATKTYVDTADALKLNLAGGTMSGDIAMGTNKVTGLGAPVSTADAATKGYVDAADALKLNLAGGTMSGNIAMGSNNITGLAAPVGTADAATKGYVDTSISNLVDSAPGALDTLNELAAALGDDPNFATTVTNEIATKVSKAGDTMTGNLVMGASSITSTATPATADTLTRKGYVDSQDALKLNLTGGTMSGAIAMGTSQITNLGDPTLAQDAATKNYVDNADALKLNLTGGTMSGVIAMATSKITGLGNPTAAQDAATKAYVDSADALKLNLAGGAMTGNLVMGANKVTSTATPTADDDLTRKAYVDSILGSATAAANSAAAAETSATNAATSAGNALTSEQNAAASFDSFDDRYLGAKASAPTLDNDGDTLLTGSLYWNTSSNNLFVWTGSEWNSAAFDVGTALFDADIGVTVQAYSSVLQNTTASFTTADESKLAGIEAGADVTDAANVNPLVDAHLNTSTANTGELLSWNGSDYKWTQAGAINDVFYENSTTVNFNYTITSGKNAVSAGPVTLASGVTVTVPSGSRWAVV